jgi:hypothetical protein
MDPQKEGLPLFPKFGFLFFVLFVFAYSVFWDDVFFDSAFISGVYGVEEVRLAGCCLGGWVLHFLFLKGKA